MIFRIQFKTWLLLHLTLFLSATLPHVLFAWDGGMLKKYAANDEQMVQSLKIGLAWGVARQVYMTAGQKVDRSFRPSYKVAEMAIYYHAMLEDDYLSGRRFESARTADCRRTMEKLEQENIDRQTVGRMFGALQSARRMLHEDVRFWGRKQLITTYFPGFFDSANDNVIITCFEPTLMGNRPQSLMATPDESLRILDNAENRIYSELMYKEAVKLFKSGSSLKQDHQVEAMALIAGLTAMYPDNETYRQLNDTIENKITDMRAKPHWEKVTASERRSDDVELEKALDQILSIAPPTTDAWQRANDKRMALKEKRRQETMASFINKARTAYDAGDLEQAKQYLRQVSTLGHDYAPAESLRRQIERDEKNAHAGKLLEQALTAARSGDIQEGRKYVQEAETLISSDKQLVDRVQECRLALRVKEKQIAFTAFEKKLNRDGYIQTGVPRTWHKVQSTLAKIEAERPDKRDIEAYALAQTQLIDGYLDIIDNMIEQQRDTEAVEQLLAVLLPAHFNSKRAALSQGDVYTGQMKRYGAMELAIEETNGATFEGIITVHQSSGDTVGKVRGKMNGMRIDFNCHKQVKGTLVLPAVCHATVQGTRLAGEGEAKHGNYHLKYQFSLEKASTALQELKDPANQRLTTQCEQRLNQLMANRPDLWLHLAGKQGAALSTNAETAMLHGLTAAAAFLNGQTQAAQAAMESAATAINMVKDLNVALPLALALADQAIDTGNGALVPNILNNIMDSLRLMNQRKRRQKYGHWPALFLGKILLAEQTDHYAAYFAEIESLKDPALPLTLALASARSLDAAQYFFKRHKSRLDTLHLLKLAAQQNEASVYHRYRRTVKLKRRSKGNCLLAQADAMMGNPEQAQQLIGSVKSCLQRDEALIAIAVAKSRQGLLDDAKKTAALISHPAMQSKVVFELTMSGSEPQKHAPTDLLYYITEQYSLRLQSAAMAGVAAGISGKAPTPVRNSQTYSTLGIRDAKANKKRGELVVQSVDPNSPAARAGLSKGDRIKTFNGQTLGAFAQLLTRTLILPVNTEVELTLLNGKQTRQVSLVGAEVAVTQ